jgi:hypothetical protein
MEPPLTDIVTEPSLPVPRLRLPLARREPGSVPATAGERPRHGALRLLGWTGLVVALTAAIGSLLARRFFYGNDDFVQFAAARDGLSWRLLGLNVFQHFGPYDRFGHWLVFRFTDLSPALGLTLVLANSAALLLAALWLMTELRLSTLRRVAALIAIALTVPTSESGIWFDAGMHILPAIAVSLAICAAHVRGVRSGRTRWHVVATVAFVLGQLIQERPLLALPLLVLVDVFLLWRTLPWRTRLQQLWGLRWPLGVLTLAAALIALALETFVVIGSFTTPSWAVTAQNMLMSLTDYVAPSLVNQPLKEAAPLSTELAVLAGILVVAALVAVARKYNAGPVLFCAAVFLLYYGFLKFSPILVAGHVDDNARRLQYAIYVTVPAIIGLAHIRLPRLPWTRADAPAWIRRVRRGLQVACCLGLAGYLLVSNVAYLDRRWADTTEARAYMDAVRADAGEWADPDVTLVPLFGLPAMATSWSTPLSRHDRLLPLIRHDFDFGDARAPFRLIDNRGSVRPAVLATVQPSVDVVTGACRTSSSPRVRHAELSFDVVQGEPLFVRLGYRADRPVQLGVSGERSGARTPNRGTMTLPAGTHTRLVPVESILIDTVDLDVSSRGSGGLCVTSASIVRPFVTEHDGTRCRTVDRYGIPGDRVTCPGSARPGA